MRQREGGRERERCGGERERIERERERIVGWEGKKGHWQ